MRDAFAAFVAAPTRENHLRIYRLVVEHPSYAPYSSDVSALEQLYAQQRFGDVVARLPELLPNCLLNPDVHMLTSLAYKHLGDAARAHAEGHVAMMCLAGIQASGDGSREAPYLVTRTEDEYALLEHLGKRRAAQALVHDGERQLERLECTDGTVVFCDVTAAYGTLARGG